jgi:aspartate kinase
MPWGLEYDMLLAAGEQQSVALLALAIRKKGGKAKPLLGHQLGIITDNFYSKARIQEIDTTLIRSLTEKGVIPVIAGFQGVDEEAHITTLGRGGSDTSAVAIAAALSAHDCEIYTDVDGIYTTDPRVCEKARKLNEISYEEMIELASLGAKVLQIRSVELAAKYQVPLHVRSSFVPIPGTRIIGENKAMEQILVSGVALDEDCARLLIRNLPDETPTLSRIFNLISEAGIVVDIIVQSRPEKGKLNLAFTVSETELEKTKSVISKLLADAFPKASLEEEGGLAKVSVVGVGMRNHPGVAAKTFSVLAASKTEIRLIATSEIKISVVIERNLAKETVRNLHQAFDLEN